MCLGLVSFCRPPPRGVGGGGDGVGGGEEGDDLRTSLSGAFSPPGFCFEKLGLDFPAHIKYGPTALFCNLGGGEEGALIA